MGSNLCDCGAMAGHTGDGFCDNCRSITIPVAEYRELERRARPRK